MKFPAQPDPRFPPRLSMDEYVDFIQASLKHVTREQVARQKALEERIEKRFRLVDEGEGIRERGTR